MVPKAANADGSTTAPSTRQYQFSPCLVEARFDDVKLHKFSNVTLSASLLPVMAKAQSTDPIQCADVPASEITSKFQHSVWAVCHPGAAERYERTGSARELYLSGVAGFVTVEKVDVERGVISLLSPCAGSLPSSHLLVGDIFWME